MGAFGCLVQVTSLRQQEQDHLEWVAHVRARGLIGSGSSVVRQLEEETRLRAARQTNQTIMFRRQTCDLVNGCDVDNDSVSI